MGSITKEINVSATGADVWDALRDYGAVHQRVVPGFVVDAVMDGADRIVTFASGAVARERLVTLDDERRRVVYSAVETQLGFTHHQATVEVFEEPGGEGCRIVWTSDFLPSGPGPIVDALMAQGAAVMEETFAAVGAVA
jgi:hypothetical protein